MIATLQDVARQLNAHGVRYIVIGTGAPELAVSEVDSGNAVTLRAMADGAVGAIKPAAILHIDRGEAVLGKQSAGCGKDNTDQPCHLRHSIYLYVWN